MWDGSSLCNSMGTTNYIRWFLFSHSVTLKFYGYLSLQEWIGDVSYIVVYPDTQLKQVKGLWHHAIIINVTCFALFVHRQALASATVTHLFFVVIKASSLLFQTPPIHGFPFLTSCHVSRSDQNGNCLDCQLKIFCWTASCPEVCLCKHLILP